MHKFVIAITGPTGSGKTSVGLALAKKIEKCVFLEVDHVKHMIISGFYKGKNEQGDETWLYSEWKLVGETVGLLCNNFLKHGFSVVIGGYMHTEGWDEVGKAIKLDYKFSLQPSKEVIKIRDTERDAKYFMGETAIQEHIDYLSGDDFKDFVAIDSTSQTVEQTVDEILSKISV